MRRLIQRIGEDVQIGPSTVKGVYVNGYVRASAAEPGIATSEPMLAVLSEEAEAVALGSDLSVAGRSWRVVEKRPDGSGVTELLLQAL